MPLDPEPLDVAALEAFYRSASGRVVAASIADRVRALWPEAASGTVVGLGYPFPWLTQGIALTLRGARCWPEHGPGRSASCLETALPVADGAVDQLLMAHVLEFSLRPRALLREVRRVLSPQGRLLLIVPARRGLWSRWAPTPFAAGRRWGAEALRRLCVSAGFAPLRLERAVFAPALAQYPMAARVAVRRTVSGGAGFRSWAGFWYWRRCATSWRR